MGGTNNWLIQSQPGYIEEGALKFAFAIRVPLIFKLKRS